MEDMFNRVLDMIVDRVLDKLDNSDAMKRLLETRGKGISAHDIKDLDDYIYEKVPHESDVRDWAQDAVVTCVNEALENATFTVEVST